MKIMVIDDSVSMRKIITSFLSSENCEIIESFKTTPLIFVTTEISDLFQKEIEKIGVSRWLNKPFGKSELLSCLT